MANDPAFLFYPGDWLGGTLGMTFEEKGAYMEVLMLQFNRGHMEGHMIGQVVGQIWDRIKHKFIQDEKGLWYNKRLELEKNKRKSFTDSRKNNLTGKNQYSNNGAHMEGHMTEHMEDRNEDKNIFVDINKFFVLKNKNVLGQSVFGYCLLNFQQLIESHIMNFGNGISIDDLRIYFDINYPNGSNFTDDRHLQNTIRATIKKLGEGKKPKVKSF